jgi:hypothetical protein
MPTLALAFTRTAMGRCRSARGPAAVLCTRHPRCRTGHRSGRSCSVAANQRLSWSCSGCGRNQTPRRWTWQYSCAGRRPRGVGGLHVEQGCDDAEDQGGALPDGNRGEQQLTELVIAVKAGREGAHLRRFHIDYLRDGEPQSLEVNWDIVACGDAVTDKDACP